MNTREKYPNSTKLTWLYFPFSPFLSGRFTKLRTEADKQNYWYADKLKKITLEILSQLINTFVYSQAKVYKTIWTSNYQASFPPIFCYHVFNSSSTKYMTVSIWQCKLRRGAVCTVILTRSYICWRRINMKKKHEKLFLSPDWWWGNEAW